MGHKPRSREALDWVGIMLADIEYTHDTMRKHVDDDELASFDGMVFTVTTALRRWMEGRPTTVTIKDDES